MTIQENTNSSLTSGKKQLTLELPKSDLDKLIRDLESINQVTQSLKSYQQ